MIHIAHCKRHGTPVCIFGVSAYEIWGIIENAYQCIKCTFNVGYQRSCRLIPISVETEDMAEFVREDAFRICLVYGYVVDIRWIRIKPQLIC